MNPQLGHDITGGMVQILEVDSKIFYFPQGHVEHAYYPVNFSAHSKTLYQISCRVKVIHYRDDPKTYELYAKLRLISLHIIKVSFDDGDVASINNMSATKNKYQSFTKTLTQSDENNGGGFSYPKFYVETN